MGLIREVKVNNRQVNLRPWIWEYHTSISTTNVPFKISSPVQLYPIEKVTQESNVLTSASTSSPLHNCHLPPRRSPYCHHNHHHRRHPLLSSAKASTQNEGFHLVDWSSRFSHHSTSVYPSMTVLCTRLRYHNILLPLPKANPTFQNESNLKRLKLTREE